MGFYLERAGRNYIIFERDGLAGILLKDIGTFKSTFLMDILQLL